MIDWILRAAPPLGVYARFCRFGVSLTAGSVSVGDKTRFLGMPCIAVTPGSTVALGSRCCLISRSSLTALGANHACTLRTLSPGALIEIGDDVGMSGGSICAAQRVTIGSRTLLGANVTIMDTDFHHIDRVPRRYSDIQPPSAPVEIGEDVFLGVGVIVLKGVTIGAGTVVGAGSVVSESLPAGVIAAGCPARVLRAVNAESASNADDSDRTGDARD
jgi:acetyltransferase-like isoleucine patch superfamily enzyme